jgi:hypothetical protein
MRQPGEEFMEAHTTRAEKPLEQEREDIRSLRNDIRELRKSQRSDFHVTWVGLIGVCTLIAKAFHWF